MLALILHAEATPMHIGSSFLVRWTLLAGMTIRPRATSERTSSGSRSSRRATNSISGVTTFLRAASSWVMFPRFPTPVRTGSGSEGLISAQRPGNGPGAGTPSDRVWHRNQQVHPQAVNARCLGGAFGGKWKRNDSTPSRGPVMSRPMLLTAMTVLLAVGPAVAQKPKEELVDQVKDSIASGVRFLKQQQRPGGDWERGAQLAGIGGTTGGPSCLCMLALLNADVPPSDPVIQLGLKYLRTIPPSGTYVVGLQTMVFAEAKEPQDKVLIERNAKWLVEAASRQNGRFIGWSYGMAFKGGSDNSNTQYALLGLHAAKQAGIKIDDKTWEEIREYYRASQSRTAGSWGYTPFDQSARLTMTM